jgi:ubiquinone/menaquinone biosynthesis C-methylase UbiE
MQFFNTDNKTAIESKGIAQWIAFGPMIFQAARVLRDTGILSAIEASLFDGLTIPEIVEKVKISEYGVRVLLESGLSIGLVVVNEEGHYTITKTGHFILHDKLTNVNMNFVHDVCYKGMFDLDKSIQTGKPEGLSVFGEWDTIYEGLSELPPQVQQSWFQFDHFFSDNAFNAVIRLVMKTQPKKLLDIGGNTGKWAIACTKYDENIQVTIMDLPGQLSMAQKSLEEHGLLNRVRLHPTNILDEAIPFPKGHDTIWMSQFLDCFSEDQIVSIMRRCYDALDENGQVFIMEPFWDCQQYETAAFCLHQTSLYFTALANGNSQMYDSRVFKKCIEKAGFKVTEQVDKIGLSQSLLQCRKTVVKNNIIKENSFPIALEN